MKIKTQPTTTFQPVTVEIVCESQEELERLAALLNHNKVANFLGFMGVDLEANYRTHWDECKALFKP